MNEATSGEAVYVRTPSVSIDVAALTVTLEVAATNEGALALYRGFGFEVVARTPVYATVL